MPQGIGTVPTSTPAGRFAALAAETCTKVDITPYGAGAQLVPAGRTARLVEEDGVLVAASDTPVDDDVIFALIDAGRK
jgi:hypothetical protein